MLENECHPLGAIAFAEARGQKPEEIPTLEEIVLKKFEVVNEVLAKHGGRLIFNPGTCSI